MMHLLRTMAVALSAAALVLTMGGAAQAQDTNGSSPRPFRVKVGGFLPYDTDTEDALGTNFLSFGLGYDWKRFDTFLPGTVELYLDYFGRPKNTIDFGRVEAIMLGGGIAAHFNLAPDARGFTPYAGAGFGLYGAFVKQTLPAEPGEPEGFSDSARRLTVGGKFLLGAELPNGLFGEVEYNFLPHPSVLGSDVALSGFQLRMGYSFRLFR